MDEYIELLDQNNFPSGTKCLKSVAHQNGYYHASVHVWFYTDKKEILLQKRLESKDTFPSLWDVSVAGHISFGEKPEKAALRETQEEIGLIISKKKLKYIGTSNHKNKHPNGLIDHELHHIYISKLDTSIKNLVIQEEEVSEIKLMHLDVFRIDLKVNPSIYVPHGADYFAKIFSEIEKLF